MKYINKFSTFILLLTVILGSCGDQEGLIYDGPSLAQFNNGDQGTLTINPSESIEHTFLVGVTAPSTEDRSFTISVGEGTTLDPVYYEIESLSGVIPAGEYTGEINITTFPTLDFPASDAQLVLNLEEVEGTEFINAGDTTLTLGFIVACAFDPATSAGTYVITRDDFETSVGDLTFEVVAGPGPNQLTVENPFDHINPATGEMDYKFIIDVDPETGEATVSRQAAWHCANFGCAYGEGRVQGSGYVFSCLETMQFNFTHTVDAGSFGTYAFAAEKQ